MSNPNIINKNFSKKLKQLRKSRNISREKFSEEIGVHPSTVQALESEPKYINTELLLRICVYFDVSPTYFFGYSKDNQFETEPMNDSEQDVDNLNVAVKKAIGKKLRQLRTSRQISLEELGRLTDRKKAGLSQLENGDCNLTTDTIISLCKLYKCEPDTLLKLSKKFFS